MTSLTAVEMASASPGAVTVDIEAQVTLVSDPNSFLGGGLAVGDMITGFLLYDEGAADTKQNDPLDGRYSFNSAPFGFNLWLAGLPFYSNPSSVDLTFRVRNDFTGGSPAGPKDSFDATSLNNLDVLPGVGVQSIRLELKDYTATALSSDELLGLSLDLNDWGSAYTLRLQGIDNWTIEADITFISREGAQPAPQDQGGGKGIRRHES